MQPAIHITPTPVVVHRILVVDDNRAIHDDFRKILGGDSSRDEFDQLDSAFFGTEPVVSPQAQFHLDFATQGREALELVMAAEAARQPYSVVFMDVRMPPGWDGIETMARLWEVDPDLQVVICTAFSDYAWEDMVSRLGRTDKLLILKKPFDMIEVVQCAHALVGKWLLLQKLHRNAEALEITVQARTAELERTNAALEREILERRRSEEALRFTQFSVDNAADAMFWMAPDSALLYANTTTCQVLGYTLKELGVMSILDLIPELRVSGWQAFWNSVRTDRHRTFELTQVTKDGRRIPVELTATFFNFSGQEMLCASVKDITQRTRILSELSAARDSAVEALRVKGEFLAKVSHEIRTPMNGIIGMAELVLHTNLDREQREYIDTIRTSADLLLDIINDILDSSKMDSGKLSFDTLDFDLRVVVDGTLDIVGGVARQKGIKLTGGVPAGVCRHLRGDPGRLRQVLTNVIGNAVKFTDQGEVILTISQLSDTETRARLRFEVKDTGIGILPDLREGIFEPFVQADSSETRRHGGTGLGLSISRQIVDALGGKIGVDSEPGAGSTFWIQLDFEKQVTFSVPSAKSRDFPVNLRVLVVDDSPTDRHILELQLANLQVRSTTVEGAAQALEKLRLESLGGDPFELALLDVQMPGMDGIELARRIKADPVMAATRLILLSSLGGHHSTAALKLVDIEAYIEKPLKQSRLQAALASVFSRGHRTESDLPELANGVPGLSHPLRILLVEDNPVNQKVALMQLRRLGYSADVANDGVQAVAAIATKDYDVVLMDCQMPNMDGYTATSEIRRLHVRPVRIIAMTANAMKGDREKCMDAGMDAFLSKPVRPDELLRQLMDCKRLPASVNITLTLGLP